MRIDEDGSDCKGCLCVLWVDEFRRIRPIECCAHSFFDELRDPASRLPNGRPLPVLFNLTEVELRANPALNHLLIPEHARAGVDMSVADEKRETGTASEAGGGGEVGGGGV